MLYWLTGGADLCMFDTETELAHAISPLVPASELDSFGPVVCIGESDGELQYAMMSNQGQCMWVLEDLRKGKWSSLRYVKSLADIENEHAKFSLNLQEEMRLQQLRESGGSFGIERWGSRTRGGGLCFLVRHGEQSNEPHCSYDGVW
ncbi:unnamed protein product [Linum trigynum]|uniref:F-box associated domain-containing protein n=1 Tax=Linum trigynum TaxID=586398 RepID=A0AAV2FJ83_9ROSI